LLPTSKYPKHQPAKIVCNELVMPLVQSSQSAYIGIDSVWNELRRVFQLIAVQAARVPHGHAGRWLQLDLPILATQRKGNKNGDNHEK